MFGAAIMLASAMAPAQTTIDFARWSMNNFQSRRESEAVAVELEFWVSPEGKIEACNVARFAGAERSAKKACEKSVGERLSPARSPAGDASYGVARTNVIMSPEGNVQARNDLIQALEESAPTEDFVLDGQAGDAIEYYAVFVDASGAIASCEAASAGTAPDRAAAVCSELTGRIRTVRHSEAGTAVAYVEKLRIRFSAQSTAIAD